MLAVWRAGFRPAAWEDRARVAVLVVGAGYVGAALASSLLRLGERVVGLDNGFSTDLAALARLGGDGDFELVHGSVTSPRAVGQAFARGPFAIVFHLAAQASAALTRRPHYTELTNLSGPRLMLDAALRHQVPRVVYASSFRVYGHALPTTLDESTAYGPQRDLVHLSQIYGEKLLELYAARAPLLAVAVRLAIVYGVGPVMKTDYLRMTVPNKFCLQTVRGEPLQVHPEATTPTAFIHLDDATAALRAAGAAPWPPGFHAANAAGEVCTVPELAATVAAAASCRGLHASIRAPADPPSGDPPHGAARVDASGAAQHWAGRGGASRLHATGWQPTRTLANTVGDLIDYFRARESQ